MKVNSKFLTIIKGCLDFWQSVVPFCIAYTAAYPEPLGGTIVHLVKTLQTFLAVNTEASVLCVGLERQRAEVAPPLFSSLKTFPKH